MQPEISTAFAKFLKCDPEGFDELRVLADSKPAETSGGIREFILNAEPHDYTDELMALLVRIEGLEAVESWIVAGWPEFSGQTKLKIIYPWSHDPAGMSTGLALRLFESPASTVRERHSIFAGLAVTARNRGVESLVLELASRIGRYEDAIKERQLESFIADVKQSLET
jgi:hypothetical protein